MTSIPLHSMPRWRTVAGEQVRAVGLMTRKAGLALIALLVVLLVAVVQSSARARGAMLDITVVPWAALGATVAALFALAMWRDEDPDRRSYHWMMPVEPHVHTLTRVLAGWVWLLAASAMSLAVIASIGALSSMITGYPQPSESVAWWWIVPITSVTVSYFLVSAAAVGTRQPVLWVVGVILLYSSSLLALDVLGYRDTHDIVRTAFTGEYGIIAALAGSIDRLDTAHLRVVPSVSRWLGAFALWGTLGAILLVATSYRRNEPRVVEAHGPFRRAIAGHAWLVASVIAFSVATGLVAARVMKPEYEAKATIWNAAAAGRVAIAVREANIKQVNDALAQLKATRIVDTVVKQFSLSIRPDDVADAPLFKDLSLGDRIVLGDYRFAVNDSGTRWHLRVINSKLFDGGVVGDSVGRTVVGLRWQPNAATLASYAGREIGFTVLQPRDVVADLLSHLTVTRQGNSDFVQLVLTDPDPQRAARTLNAITAGYVSKIRSQAGTPLALLDSAVAPRAPFKNSPAQLFAVAIVIGIAVAIGLAFAASALEGQVRT